MVSVCIHYSRHSIASGRWNRLLAYSSESGMGVTIRDALDSWINGSSPVRYVDNCQGKVQGHIEYHSTYCNVQCICSVLDILGYIRSTQCCKCCSDDGTCIICQVQCTSVFIYIPS